MYLQRYETSCCYTITPRCNYTMHNSIRPLSPTARSVVYSIILFHLQPFCSTRVTMMCFVMFLFLLICLFGGSSSFRTYNHAYIVQFQQIPSSAFYMTSDSAESPTKNSKPGKKLSLPTIGKPLTKLAQSVYAVTPNELKNALAAISTRVSKAVTKVDTYLEKRNLKKSITKEELSKLGLYALLSYGFVSNFSYITCVIIAWVIHGKSTGLSPLCKGQWKQFLAVYTGLYVANNFLRPARFWVSVLIAPKFEDMIQFVMKKTGLKKSFATAVVVFLVNFCGTIAYLIGGLRIATLIFGVPLGA